MRRALGVLPLAAALLFLAAVNVRSEEGPVAGDERVLSFRSEITVLPDASLVVRETIRVRAAGRAINHGIYRDFHTRLRRPEGITLDAPLGLIEVLRDGKPEPWHTRESEHGLRAYFGAANRLLEPGEHTYAIAYRTESQLGRSAGHDELVWNVTGHDWTLPIDEVEARVLLPHGVTGVTPEFRTGARGSMGREATVESEGEHSWVFRAARPIRPGEGLTVILRWPRGFVREPELPQGWWSYFLGSNRGLLAGLAGLLLVLTYNFLAGRHAARYTLRGAAAPCGEVPAGLSPAALRVVRSGPCDDRAFAATVVQMAVKGYLVIEERSGGYALHRGEADRAALAPEEALIADDLDLEWARRIGLEPANRVRIGAAENDLENFLRISLERFHALRNREYLLPGVALSVVVVVSTLRLEPGLQSFIRGLISVLLFFWTIGVSLLAVQFLLRWQDVLRRREPRRDVLFHAASITVLAAPVFAVELAGLGLVAWLGSLSYGAMLLCLAFLNVSFHYLLKAPSRGSRVLLDRIEDFVAILAGGEAGAAPPGREPTPAQYEAILPYAIALDRERQWSRQCAGALSRPGADGRRYEPAWYRTEPGAGDRLPALLSGIVGDALCTALAVATRGAEGTPAGGAPDR